MKRKDWYPSNGKRRSYALNNALYNLRQNYGCIPFIQCLFHGLCCYASIWNITSVKCDELQKDLASAWDGSNVSIWREITILLLPSLSCEFIKHLDEFWSENWFVSSYQWMRLLAKLVLIIFTSSRTSSPTSTVNLKVSTSLPFLLHPPVLLLRCNFIFQKPFAVSTIIENARTHLVYQG